MAITSHIAPCPPDFPAHWRDILEENVAIYRRLPEGLTLRVEELMPWFIEKVSWEWSHWGAAVPDQELQKVCVACEACLLIARRSVKDYTHFKKFIFFPVDLTVVKENYDAVGDAWASGKIRQGWEWTQTGMEDGADNYNVTIHEFAHMIDYRNTPSDSVPHFEDAAVEREYKAFMKSEYADICRAWKKKSGNDLLRPNKRNRSHTNAKGKKYFLNVDANAEKQEADALGTDTVERRIEEDKRKARGRGAEKAQPKRRVRNARQQTRSTAPKRNATKRSNNITLPQTGAVNRRKSQPSTGLDDESDMTWEALDTIDTKLDELTTKIADTILRSADDPVLKRQSQIQQRRILEIKELLKSLKEDSAFIKLGD